MQSMTSRFLVVAGVLTAAASLAPRADACDPMPCEPGSLAPFGEYLPLNVPRLAVVAGVDFAGDGSEPQVSIPEPGVNISLTAGETVIDLAVERQGDTLTFHLEPLQPLIEGTTYELTYTYPCTPMETQSVSSTFVVGPDALPLKAGTLDIFDQFYRYAEEEFCSGPSREEAYATLAWTIPQSLQPYLAVGTLRIVVGGEVYQEIPPSALFNEPHTWEVTAACALMDALPGEPDLEADHEVWLEYSVPGLDPVRTNSRVISLWCARYGDEEEWCGTGDYYGDDNWHDGEGNDIVPNEGNDVAGCAITRAQPAKNARWLAIGAALLGLCYARRRR